MGKQKFKYKEALSELEKILKKMEANELDIDELASEVKKASGLLKKCKETLRSTEKDLDAILSEMNE